MCPDKHWEQLAPDVHWLQFVMQFKHVFPERYCPAEQLRQIDAEEQVRQGLEHATATELVPSSKNPSLGRHLLVVELRYLLSDELQSVQRPEASQ